MSQLDTPVLLVGFNRPETTEKVFDVIRGAAPKRLYIALDGPRSSHPDDRESVALVKRVVGNVDWPCEVHTLFRDTNLGCKHAVSEAITWFFSCEEQGIILEDDCVVHHSFFGFATELLSRYKDDKRVMSIAAQHLHGDAHTPPHSYYFSRYSACWGWASWRRAWQYYDLEMISWPKVRESDWLLDVGAGSLAFRNYWRDVFDRTFSGEVDTWDYQWTYSMWQQHGLAALPSKNLVQNIGFGGEATHTMDSTGVGSELSLQEMAFPLIHPDLMIRDFIDDRWTDSHVFNISYKEMIKGIVRKSPGGKILATGYRYLRGIGR